jgi:hypothetical protein
MRRLTTLLPAMTLVEAIETSCIHRITYLTGARTALLTICPCHNPASDDLGCGADRRRPRAAAGGGICLPARPGFMEQARQSIASEDKMPLALRR